MAAGKGDDIAAMQAQYDSIVRRLDDLASHHEKDIDRVTSELDRRFADVKERVDVARRANDDRFDSVNEFRGQLADSQARFLTRDEYGVQHAALIERFEAGRHDVDARIDNILKRQEEDRAVVLTFQGRAIGLTVAFGLIASAVTAIIIKATGG